MVIYVIKMYVHAANVSYKDENTISVFNNTLERLKRRLSTADDKIIQKTGQWKSQKHNRMKKKIE